MIECIVFDLDDTLYPEIQYVESGFNAVAPVLSKWLKRSKEQVISELWDEFHRDRKHVFDSILVRNGLCERSRISFLVALYRSHLPLIRLYPDAEEILSWLIRKSFKIGILTDGCAYAQSQKIRALRLAHILDGIVYTDLLGREYWKPHVKPYKVLMENLNCEPSRALYVGDNPIKDFYGARKIGMYTIQINRMDGLYSEADVSAGYEADKMIESLLDLKSIINDL